MYQIFQCPFNQPYSINLASYPKHLSKMANHDASTKHNQSIIRYHRLQSYYIN